MNSHQILVVTTGGTIEKDYFDALSEYQIVDSVIPALLERARVVSPFRVVELLRKDSLDLTDADRADIVQQVADAPESRIVITHGTDTMTQTAKVLAARVPDKTIVLTGAFAPARFANSDAAFNMGMAFAAAQTAAPGVWIAMNGQVFDGLNVQKNREAGKFAAIE